MTSDETRLSSFPRRSLTDMIIYCDDAMKEEGKRGGPNGVGLSRRHKMAKEMRVVLMDIRARKTRRDYHGA